MASTAGAGAGATAGGDSLPSELPVTARTKIKRLPKRSVLDRETAYRVIDAAVVCHVATVRAPAHPCTTRFPLA